MLAVGASVCRDLTAALKREWLETNGIGGYASSTIALTNTRRYHGLLVAALSPPDGRTVLLAKLDESLIQGGSRYDLATNQYPDIVYPQGHLYLEEFRLDPYPVFTYRVPGGLLEKSLFLVHGENTLVVFYRLSGEEPALLEIRPLVAFRSYHELGRENESLNRVTAGSPGVLKIEPFAGMPPLTFAHGGTFRSEGYWYRNFEYVEEAYRGYAFREDLYSYGSWTRTLTPGREIAVVVSTADAASMDARLLRDKEVARRKEMVERAAPPDDVAAALAAAADQFLVRGADRRTVILGGYPWFAGASRDAAIALPGLTLATRRFEEARGVIRGLLLELRDGLLPAKLLEGGAAEETPPPSADAVLWLFVAVHEYLRATGDETFVTREAAAPLLAALRSIRAGESPGVRVDADGLLVTTAGGGPMTWMNARVGEWVATERAGRAVEVEALWINALSIGSSLAARMGRSAESIALEESAEAARARFEELFWDEERGSLRDVADAADPSPGYRPNAIIALSLPHAVLGAERGAKVVAACRAGLLTPVGLRTLSPSDPLYKGRCVGDAWLREKASHQGSVWPWLLGPYLRAARRYGDAGDASARLAFLASHLVEAGVGTVSEIFDGDAPHTPRGAIASCVAVGELLRALVESSEAAEGDA